MGGETKIAGAILAGGRASRFDGRTKGRLRLPDGRTFAERLLNEMREAGLEQVIISANNRDAYAGLRVPVVPDLTPSIGPLGGIEAVLNHYQQSAAAVLIAPCDLPRFGRGELSRLVDGFLNSPDSITAAKTSDGIRHPLCCVMPVALMPRITEAIREGRFGMTRLWNEMDAKYIMFDQPDRFININSADEYQRLKENVWPPR